MMHTHPITEKPNVEESDVVLKSAFKTYFTQSRDAGVLPEFRVIEGGNRLLKNHSLHEYDIVVDGGNQHWMVFDGEGMKVVVNSTDMDYIQIFDKTTGYNIRMGKDKDTDPEWCPLGPEILDFEISINGCPKVGGASCKFCCPPNTKITLANGMKKNIQDIIVGDEVLSLSIGKTNHFVKNDVAEIYDRDYDGELIVFEMEDGKILKVTPNHPFVLRDGTEVKAEDVTPDMDIVIEEEYAHCSVCGKPKVHGDKFVCSEECKDKNHGTLQYFGVNI